jgi:hypothetical protein
MKRDLALSGLEDRRPNAGVHLYNHPVVRRSTLILTINRFEQDRQLASALEFLVGALGAAALAHRLLS